MLPDSAPPTPRASDCTRCFLGKKPGSRRLGEPIIQGQGGTKSFQQIWFRPVSINTGVEPLLLESALVRPVKHQSTKVSNNVQTRFQQTGKMCARLKKYGTELPTKLQTAMISLEKRQGRVNVHVASVYLL